jgi:hypothetical protein
MSTDGFKFSNTARYFFVKKRIYYPPAPPTLVMHNLQVAHEIIIVCLCFREGSEHQPGYLLLGGPLASLLR